MNAIASAHVSARLLIVLLTALLWAVPVFAHDGIDDGHPDEVTTVSDIAANAAIHPPPAPEPPEGVLPDVSALTPAQPDEFYLGRVESFVAAGDGTADRFVRIRVESGPEDGDLITLDYPAAVDADPSLRLAEGERLVLVKSFAQGREQYYIGDRYRTPRVAVMLALFFALAVFFGRRRGATSFLGLAFSILVLVWFIVPRIAAGENPLPTVLLGSLGIMVVSLYLAHGVNRRTTIALGGSAVTLAFALGIALIAVRAAQIFGMGSEEAFYLQTGFGEINLTGLLLGGIIIGTLGVLDDITTAQSAVVEELSRANPSLGFAELYRRGLSVGREHIASLTNTLVLAYAGASLPLLLLFTVSKSQPWWVILNSEFIVEEAVRTLVGSAALILAVPITTAIAARYWGRRAVDAPASAD